MHCRRHTSGCPKLPEAVSTAVELSMILRESQICLDNSSKLTQLWKITMFKRYIPIANHTFSIAMLVYSEGISVTISQSRGLLPIS